MAPSASVSRQLTISDFTVPVALVFLSIVPTIGGIVRLVKLAPAATISPDDARFLQAPAPVLIHILCVTPYCILGAFQFSRAMRRRWPRWHRRAGRGVAVSGFLAAATGLWMTTRYEIPSSLQGPLLYSARLGVAAAMMGAILIGWRSILRRDVARHEAFMIRAYALGQGAGTQVLILGPWTLITGSSGGVTRDVLMTVSWLINVVVAELIIRTRLSARPKAPPAQGPSVPRSAQPLEESYSTATAPRS
jgi:uncharacterized membrane protein